MHTTYTIPSFALLKEEIITPAIQRNILPNQVMKMREHIQHMFKQKKYPYFGVIDVVRFNNTLFCVDEQHRLKALEEEYKENGINIPINFIEYIVTSKDELFDVFKIRNSNIALSEYLFDNTNENKKNLLKKIQEYIQTKKGFTNKSNRPNIKTDDYMNVLTKSKLFKHIHTLNDFIKIYNWINMHNKKKIQDNIYIKKYKITDKMCKIWNENLNYHGIDLHFPFFNEDLNDDILNRIICNDDYMDIDDEKETIEIKRKKFTASERAGIWNKYIGLKIGEINCPYCHNFKIYQTKYVVGHVISLFNGGGNEIENVRPICDICNSSMSSNDMDLKKWNINII